MKHYKLKYYGLELIKSSSTCPRESIYPHMLLPSRRKPKKSCSTQSAEHLNTLPKQNTDEHRDRRAGAQPIAGPRPQRQLPLRGTIAQPETDRQTRVGPQPHRPQKVGAPPASRAACLPDPGGAWREGQCGERGQQKTPSPSGLLPGLAMHRCSAASEGPEGGPILRTPRASCPTLCRPPPPPPATTWLRWVTLELAWWMRAVHWAWLRAPEQRPLCKRWAWVGVAKAGSRWVATGH